MSGRFGGVVFSRWQGVSLIRKFTPPAQPRTPAQVAQRELFTNLNRSFPFLRAHPRSYTPWQLRASGVPGIPRSLYLGRNSRNLTGETSLEAFDPIDWPAHDIGDQWTLTAGGTTAGQVTVTVTPTSPTVPQGVSVSNVILVIAKDDNWSQINAIADLQVAVPTGGGGTTAVTHTFTGLTEGDGVRIFAALTGPEAGMTVFNAYHGSATKTITHTVPTVELIGEAVAA